MLVVSDASPLHYLVLLEQVEVLPRLFGRVLVPQRVFAELTSPGAPHSVREWAENRPHWLEIRQVEKPLSGDLDPGEAEAIALALEVSADLILIDDWKGRRAATTVGLQMTGLVGLLGVAAANGMINLEDVVVRLKETNFRIAPRLLEDLLKEKGNDTTD